VIALDSHAHLDDPEVGGAPLHDQLARLIGDGWQGAVTAGYGPERFEASRLLCQRFSAIHRAIALHPAWLAQAPADTREPAWQQLLAELDRGPVAAIGEIGLDRRYREVLGLPEQIAWFHRGLQLAQQRQLPVVLHLVGWHGHALDMLRPFPLAQGGVIHRYSGATALVPKFTALGLHISLSLEPRQDLAKRAALARAIPFDRLLVETDWPFAELSYPQSLESMTVMTQQIADWRGETLANLQIQLAKNAAKLYGIAVSESALKAATRRGDCDERRDDDQSSA